MVSKTVPIFLTLTLTLATLATVAAAVLWSPVPARAGLDLPSSVSGVPSSFVGSLQFSIAPNPLSSATQLSFAMPEGGHVSLAIHDAQGRRVRSLLDGSVAAGTHQVPWDGRDDAGRLSGAGVYYATIRAAGGLTTRAVTTRAVTTRAVTIVR